MLLRIGKKNEGETVLDLLRACHARIRHFTALAGRLSADAPAGDLREAAGAVERYFVHALPKHDADEERSIAPRLRAARPDLLPVLAAIEREHAAIEATIAAAAPRWRALRDDPTRRAELAADLDADARALAATFEGHLLLEEERLFPAVAALERDPDLLAEMRARRLG